MREGKVATAGDHHAAKTAGTSIMVPSCEAYPASNYADLAY